MSQAKLKPAGEILLDFDEKKRYYLATLPVKKISFRNYINNNSP